VPYTCIFSMYMGAIYMYIDCVYECYIHLFFVVLMGVMYMYIDDVYGW